LFTAAVDLLANAPNPLLAQAPADIDNDVDDVGNDAALATPNLSTPAPFENSNHGSERGSQVT